MHPARGSRMLQAMLVGLAVTAGAVAVYSAWLDQRRRPAMPPSGPAPVSAPAPQAADAAPTSRTLHRCVAAGEAPVYTTAPCPSGTALAREIDIAPIQDPAPGLRRARERCEAGRRRERIELAKLGARRSAADLRLWGDYALRECAAYTAMVR